MHSITHSGQQGALRERTSSAPRSKALYSLLLMHETIINFIGSTYAVIRNGLLGEAQDDVTVKMELRSLHEPDFGLGEVGGCIYVFCIYVLCIYVYFKI